MEVFRKEGLENTYYENKEFINILRDGLQSVCDIEIESKNKYVDLARKYKYRNYRFGSLGDFYRLGLMKSMNEYQKKFFNKCGMFIAIFNEISGKPVSIIFRSLKEKDFLDISLFPSVYGIDLLESDFRYGDYIVITEGIYDADSFRPIYKNIISALTSNISAMSVEVLSTLTDKFIFAFDNDRAGKEGIENGIKKLKIINSKCEIETLNIYEGDKDLGGIEENYTDDKILYYRNNMKILLG